MIHFINNYTYFQDLLKRKNAEPEDIIEGSLLDNEIWYIDNNDNGKDYEKREMVLALERYETPWTSVLDIYIGSEDEIFNKWWIFVDECKKNGFNYEEGCWNI